MKEFLPILAKDFYKAGHPHQYEKDTSLVYSNMTARASRSPWKDGVIVFGPQYLVLDMLIDQWNRNFFKEDRDKVLKAYKRRMDNAGLGMDVSHVGELHELGYLPIHLKALPEGTLCPLRVPFLTIRNTQDPFFWVTNMLETQLSNHLWRMITSATTSFNYRRVFEKFARETGGDLGFVPWQGHDFSCRGLDPESSIMSGAAHLLSFTGTDTILAIDFLEAYYGANSDTELVGGSVPATEHSVMCMGQKSGELATIRRLAEAVYPKGIASIVSDTWDLWKVLTEYLPSLKDVILARDGKIVIRPDSGNPADILCGDPKVHLSRPAAWGVIRLLDQTFGHTVNEKGFKVLNPHVGAIYGDSISPERQVEILSRLASMGWASTNVVLGIGSYTFQYVTRDTYGLAVKATYGEVKNSNGSVDCYNIFKDPVTDDGTKKSACGLLKVDSFPLDNGGELRCVEGVSWAEEASGLLQTIFLDGEAKNLQTLAQIRQRVEGQL